MKNRKLLTVAVLLIGTLGVITVMPAGAQTSGSYWQFSAKFLCGEMINDRQETNSTTEPDEQPVVNGRYRTAINFHNASLGKTISRFSIAKKALVLYPTDPVNAPHEAAQSPETFRRPPTNVPPDGGFEIDCPDIRRVLLGDDPNLSGDQTDERHDSPFIKGYVVILVSSSLVPDVVAAYTAYALADEDETLGNENERGSNCEVNDECDIVQGHSEQIVNIPARKITTSD